MTAWEYLEVEIQLNVGKYRTYVNGNEVTNMSKINRKVFFDTLHECPNYYGKKGWELIKMGSAGADDNTKKWFLFKRQN
tara:strand:+ start:24 stop:260 length:237 start_codon:yes stop_codon:yes gene_type:complete